MLHRKIAALFLCLLVLSCAGCGKKPATDGDTSSMNGSTVSLTEGVDVIDASGMKNVPVIDFETGSVVSMPDENPVSSGNASVADGDIDDWAQWDPWE